MWDKLKPSSSNPNKTERKFVKVNYSYETIFGEVGWDVLGTPLVMMTYNLEKNKTLNNWYIFHEDYSQLIEDCISLQVRVDNHMQKGELSKYMKESSLPLW